MMTQPAAPSSTRHRCNALLAGILYFQSTDSGQAVRPDIDCFREICDSTNFYSFVVLVATGKRLIEAGEIETWNDAVRQGAKTFLYLSTPTDSAVFLTLRVSVPCGWSRGDWT
ncbi:hypothetical protein PISMIDRAFT_682355 [Pisolithus microcarpus 441]|uniref:Uncharacterized protein n=1 Tax=Pisolithus microcarpus 441 TaxID=765257 RepID=A0A0C9YUD6_9AGAM|nr:hypothetical protein PISMIDRAFT_682355 [Pisolithus microcarpus 441]